MVSEEELDAAETRQKETLGVIETARLAHREARVRAGSPMLAKHPRVLVAVARLRASYRDWRKTLLIAPIDGEIARRRVQAGQRIQPGTPLFSIADRRNAWVEANFKENQLRHIRPGQAVEMYSDLYGEDIVLAGRVASIGTGTGAIFSLLPPQNATGNWIKIVQRVPVRIELEEGFDAAHPLPFGSSLHVRIDTHDRSGPPLVSREGVDPVVDTGIYAYQDEGADELIASIIAAASKPLINADASHVPK
jgi:membrane fusion protein (multidrug efflux system)